MLKGLVIPKIQTDHKNIIIIMSSNYAKTTKIGLSLGKVVFVKDFAFKFFFFVIVTKSLLVLQYLCHVSSIKAKRVVFLLLSLLLCCCCWFFCCCCCLYCQNWRNHFYEKKNKQLPQLMSFIEKFSWEVNN